jgi:predicted NBD/HSP70 family sugar kinase
MKNVLVIDIGGTNVKLMISREERRKFESGAKLTPKQLVKSIEKTVEGWDYDAISIGFPSVVRDNKILKDPKHLAQGWVNWNPRESLGKPVRIINDAAMQALGSYHGGGRMLFLGLGTGLGSALIWDNNLLPLELGDLPYPDVARIEDTIGKDGLKELGRKAWQREVTDIVTRLKLAFIADYVVLGGGNSKQMDELPKGVELGNNRNAFPGGARLWEIDPRTRRPKWNVID